MQRRQLILSDQKEKDTTEVIKSWDSVSMSYPQIAVLLNLMWKRMISSPENEEWKDLARDTIPVVCIHPKQTSVFIRLGHREALSKDCRSYIEELLSSTNTDRDIMAFCVLERRPWTMVDLAIPHCTKIRFKNYTPEMQGGLMFLNTMINDFYRRVMSTDCAAEHDLGVYITLEKDTIGSPVVYTRAQARNLMVPKELLEKAEKIATEGAVHFAEKASNVLSRQASNGLSRQARRRQERSTDKKLKKG